MEQAFGLQLADFLSFAVALPLVSTLFASALGIHSLWSDAVSRRKATILISYVLIALLIGFATAYNAALQERDGRRLHVRQEKTDDQIATIAAVVGSAPNTPPDEVLGKIISKFSQPATLSQAQIAVLSKQFALLKSDLPRPARIYLTIAGNNNGSSLSMVNGMTEVLDRNGFNPQTSFYSPHSLEEAGFCIVVKDALHPPVWADQLLAAFRLAAAPVPKMIEIKDLYSPSFLTFFVGPTPL